MFKKCHQELWLGQKMKNPETDYDLCPFLQHICCLHTNVPLSCVLVNVVLSRLGAYVRCVVLHNWYHACQTFLSAVHSATYEGRRLAVISFACIGNSAIAARIQHSSQRQQLEEKMTPQQASEREKSCNIPNNGKLPQSRAWNFPVCLLATCCSSLPAIMMFCAKVCKTAWQ